MKGILRSDVLWLRFSKTLAEFAERLLNVSDCLAHQIVQDLHIYSRTNELLVPDWRAGVWVEAAFDVQLSRAA